MAQLLTTIHCSHRINPTNPLFPFKSMHKLGFNYDRVTCVFETRRSLGKTVSASPRLSSKRLLTTRRSASNINLSGGQQGNVIEVEDGEAMEKYIEDAGDKMVVVNVSTTICGPCKLISPKVVKMSIEYPDTLFYKINGDKSSSTRALMRKWGIRAVPNFRFYRRGELLHSHSGANEDELRAHFITHYVGVQSVTT